MKLIKALSALDWFLSGATLVVGGYLKDPLIAGAGVLGLCVAWYGPAERIKAYLEKRFLRKTKVVKSDASAVAAEDDFYAASVAAAEVPQVQEASVAPRTFGHVLKPGAVYLHSSAHNVLKAEHLQLTPGARSAFWA